mgnify:FL=1
MLTEANVTTKYSVGGVAAVTRRDTLVIDSVTFESGLSLAAKVWIDASYEGGIAEHVATMTWGRESKAEYDESAAGRLQTSTDGKPSLHILVHILTRRMQSHVRA